MRWRLPCSGPRPDGRDSPGNRHEFTAANALLQTTTSIGIIVGPALSGVGIVTMSSREVLCVNAVSYVISALCFLLIRFPRIGNGAGCEGASAGTLRDGMKGFSMCPSAAGHPHAHRRSLHVYLRH